MQKTYNIYHNLGYWFLFFIILVFAGFYKTYFVALFVPKAPVVHIHFALMILWIAMLIIQPFLIKYKKLEQHRMIGKLSYVLVPLLLLSAFFMMRFSYYHFIDDLNQKAAQGLNQLSNTAMLKQAAAYQAITIVYFLWFSIFYSLAIMNRRKSSVHARYMVATALTLIGPTVDRIIFFVFNLEKLPGSIPVESVSFLLINIVLSILLLKDYQHKREVKALGISLIIYSAGEILYFTIPGTDLWQNFVTFIMRPAP